MKISREYLIQVIKEELEQEMDEGIGDFLTKARKTVFGLNAQEKIEKEAKDWFTTGPGARLMKYLEDEARKPTYINYNSVARQLLDGLHQVGNWKKYFPKTEDYKLKQELKKIYLEKLKHLEQINKKAMIQHGDEEARKERLKRGKFKDPRTMTAEERSCLSDVVGVRVGHPEFDKEYAKIIKQITDMSTRGDYGSGYAHPADIQYQQCQGPGSTGLSGKLSPYTGRARR